MFSHENVRSGALILSIRSNVAQHQRQSREFTVKRVIASTSASEQRVHCEASHSEYISCISPTSCRALLQAIFRQLEISSGKKPQSLGQLAREPGKGYL